MNYIHPTAIVYPNVKLGDNIYIGPYCIIGDRAEHKAYWGNEDPGRVIIHDNCVITGFVSIDAGTEHPTYISNDVWILKHAHVGHDAFIGPNCVISCGAKIGGHVQLHHKCNIGLNAVIHQKQEIAPGCMIGMGAVVTKGLVTKPFQKYAGNPAKWLGPNEVK